MTSNNIRYNVETEFLEIDSKGAWPILYQHIRSECLNYEYTVQEARKTHNKNLNRYRDVSPYDHSRIVLSKGPCDYINASLVTIGKANRRYILTQGPLSHTTGHFWLMVWEQNCKAVLMLNRIIEKKQEKCHQYWPLATRCGVDDEMVLKEVGLKIQFISEKCASYYTTRTLRLTEIESGNSRDILHFHYTTWPDFGVPQSPTAFLEFLMVVRRSGVLSPNVGPPVVHCSAGIGRSGTFCLVDSCLVLIEENGIGSVNVREILLEMRKYRMGLIQTPDQLRFSYLAIIEGAKLFTNKNHMDDSSFMDTMEISRNNANSTEIELEWMKAKDENEIEEPPPPPPPRGESLKKSIPPTVLENYCGGASENILPPDKPLPIEPSNNSSDMDLCTEDSTTAEKLSSLLFRDPPLETSKIGEENESERSVLRQRKQEERRERRERLASQVREMKRKQEESESWQKWKKSIFTPLNLGVGVGILLIGGGVMAYVYYSNKM
ncbi:Tyrosine-protein phosphatase non-receptor type 61F [Gryllus bimaculatus]|nr:Tyrosine-protein phosphatase non-receptor type 61F [Gryllus bimaculatus]